MTANRRLTTEQVVEVSVPEVDRATRARFEVEITSAAPLEAQCLVLDLTNVTFLDCGGAATVLEIDRSMAAAGGRLVLRNTGRGVRRVLELVGARPDLFA